MVAVLVGDEDAGQILRREPEAGEAPLDLARAEPAVEHQPGAVGLDDDSVAPAAAPEGCEPQLARPGAAPRAYLSWL